MSFLNSSERNWLAAGVGLLLSILCISGFISYQNVNQLVESSNKSQRTYEIIKNLDDVFSEITIAESARRGYIYLGNRSELDRYDVAIQKIPFKLHQLHQQFALEQGFETYKELEKMALQRVELLEDSIALYEANQTAVMQQGILTNRSIALRERIHTMIAELVQQQQAQLRQSIENSKQSIQIRKAIEIWTMIVGFMAIFVCFLALYGQVKQRHQAEYLQQKLVQQKEVSNLKTHFFSMVSHEFRTPLSVILGSVQLLIKGNSTWSEERRIKNLDRIQSAAKSMQHLFIDVLTLTRADAGKLECNPEAIDLEAFCLNLVEDFEISTEHVIHFQTQDELTHACLDERLLYSILSNLIANAIKYSAPGSKVLLLLEGTSDRVRFQVRDQGIGISLEDQSKLGEPFFRGQNSSYATGTGLGLAVVKKCVDLQNGVMTIQSEKDRGTIVRIEFDRHVLPKNNRAIAVDQNAVL
ncbi:MAG: ATP-binding protein [Leptolyngbya sp. Prado105]|jgi:signal transduction histidine kinase|nr:ATP-binding protein [Leptolyngbya sp. Prado105]